MKELRQMVFLSILRQSRNKVAVKCSERSKEKEIRSKSIQGNKQRQNG